MGNVFGIVFATPQEAGPFRACVSASGGEIERRRGDQHRSKGSFHASFNGHRVIAIVAGMGADPARRAALDLVSEENVDWLVSAGVCGGLWEGLRVLDVLQAAAVLDAQGRWHRAEPLVEIQNHGVGPRVDLVDARLYSAPAILRSRRAKRDAREATSADAVDMESAAIAAVATEHGVRFSALRGISDAADHILPLDFSRFVNTAGRLRTFPLILNIAFRPWTVPGLMRLAERTKQASQRVAAVLVEAIRAPSSPVGYNEQTRLVKDELEPGATGSGDSRASGAGEHDPGPYDQVQYDPDEYDPKEYDLEGCNSGSLGITHVA